MKKNHWLHSHYLFVCFSFSFLFLLFFLSSHGIAAQKNVLPVKQVKVSAERGDATIFIYHHFGDNRYPTTNVSVKKFIAQMQYLSDNNYSVIPLAHLVGLLKSKTPIPPNTAVITIDDGYRSVYNEAWPILKSFGFPFTVFLYVEGIERGFRNYLSWEQILEMQKEGVDFQDHSFSHKRMADWPQGLTEDEYRQWIKADLVSSITVLRERLNTRPRFFAIPYGEYNSIVMEEAKALGYEAIFTQDPGSVSDDTDVFFIPREPILGNEWSTLKHFVKVLKRVDLPLAALNPNIRPLRDKLPNTFGARLKYPERYQPGSFGIYVSELGWQPGQLMGDRISIVNDVPLARRSNRVMVSAREKGTGRVAVRFWLLMLHESSVVDQEMMNSVLQNQSLQQ